MAAGRVIQVNIISLEAVDYDEVVVLPEGYAGEIYLAAHGFGRAPEGFGVELVLLGDKVDAHQV